MVARMYKCVVCGCERMVNDDPMDNPPLQMCCNVPMRSVPQVAYTHNRKKGSVNK